MTRQNQIPTKDGSQATFGLIPYWDMCNHSNGYVSTDLILLLLLLLGGWVVHVSEMMQVTMQLWVT